MVTIIMEKDQPVDIEQIKAKVVEEDIDVLINRTIEDVDVKDTVTAIFTDPKQTITYKPIVEEYKAPKKGLGFYTNKLKQYLKSLIVKPYSKVVSLWRNEKLADLKDLGKFVIVHGILGLFILLTLLYTLGIQRSPITYLMSHAWIAMIVILLGMGAAYYCLMDLNKMLGDTWRRKK